MFKVLKVATLGGILVAGANAEDFLAKVTTGALSDVSSNVKKLYAADMNEVRGGLEFKGPWKFSYNESGAYAVIEENKDSRYIKEEYRQRGWAHTISLVTTLHTPSKER